MKPKSCGNCEGVNTRLGIGDLVDGERRCDFGYKQNPKTEAATINLIRNGGWHIICLNNPYKYKHIPAN